MNGCLSAAVGLVPILTSLGQGRLCQTLHRDHFSIRGLQSPGLGHDKDDVGAIWHRFIHGVIQSSCTPVALMGFSQRARSTFCAAASSAEVEPMGS